MVERVKRPGKRCPSKKEQEVATGILGKSQAPEHVIRVLERHCELVGASPGELSDGSGLLLTYLLFPEDLVPLDPPRGLLAQDPPFLLDVPAAQAALDYLRTTGRFCRHPDDMSFVKWEGHLYS